MHFLWAFIFIDCGVSYLLHSLAAPGLQERWFALVKLGELHERFLGDQVQARSWYAEAIRVDAERADGWFVTPALLPLLYLSPRHCSFSFSLSQFFNAAFRKPDLLQSLECRQSNK